MNTPGLEEIFGSYMAWKAEEDTWFISFMNGSQMLYLLEGSEKALLIDTGYAIGNLRQFVEKLTKQSDGEVSAKRPPHWQNAS